MVCGTYETLGDEPSDILDNDCRDSSGDTEFELGFEFLPGVKSGISNDIEVGRFNGLGLAETANVGENAAVA